LRRPGKINWQRYPQFIIFATVFLYPCWLFAGQDGRTMQVGNIRIQYDLTEEENALKVASILQTVLPRMEQFYSTDLPRGVRIVIVSDEEMFFTIIGHRLPAWVGAVYIPDQKTILLKSPRWKGTLFDMRKSLVHELSHAYFHERFSRQSLPLWFNEGLAELISEGGISMDAGIELAKAIWFRHLVSLADIDSLFQFSAPRAQLAYIESLSAMVFIQEQLPNGDSWPDFLSHVATFGLENTLKNRFGWDLIDFEIKWYNWLRHKYRWFILLNFDYFIWLLLIVIFMLAVVRRYLMNRKRLRQWEREEQWLFGDSEYYPNDPEGFDKR